MSLYAFDAVEDALDSTRAFLFPFDLKQWLKLAFLLFFIGSSSGSPPTQFTSNVPDMGGTPTPPGGLPSIGGAELAIIAAIGVGFLLVAVAFALVGSVFEFVFVNSLREERVAIREYWGEFWGQGLRLFGFRLVLGLGFLLVVGGLLAVAFAPFLFGNEQFSPGMLGVSVLGIVLVAFLVGLIQGFTTEFIVPVMLLNGGGVVAAWRAFWPTLRSEWKQYVAYVVLRFVLTIATGILVAIVLGILGLILAIPFGILGFVGYTLLSSQALVGWALIAFAVGLFVLAFVLLSLLTAVPVQTYFRYYALLVLGDTNADFDLIPDRRNSVRS